MTDSAEKKIAALEQTITAQGFALQAHRRTIKRLQGIVDDVVDAVSDETCCPSCDC